MLFGIKVNTINAQCLWYTSVYIYLYIKESLIEFKYINENFVAVNGNA